MALEMDTVRCIPSSRLSPILSTLISYVACHYHLRIKLPNATPPTGEVDQKLWMLLTRHVADTKKNSDYIALRVENEFDRRISQQKIDRIAEAVSWTGLMPAYLYLSGSGVISQGSFTNSTHVLVSARGSCRTRLEDSYVGFSSYLQAQVSAEEIRDGSLSLIASYDGEAEEVGFTITAFSTIPSVSWDETPTKLPFSHKVRTTLPPPQLIVPSPFFSLILSLVVLETDI